MISAISQAFAHGGVWMYAILAAQIVSIAIIAERVYALYVARQKNQKNIATQLEGDIKKGLIESAQLKARNLAQEHAIGAVAAAGIQAAANMGGKDEVHARMDEMINIENSKLETRTPMLAMIGNVATLIGLLGTITGMIKSFSAVSAATGVEKATLLSAGISEAMNCTAYGLIVAIPALILHSVLTSRSHELQDDLNQASTKVHNWLCYSFDTVPKTKKKSL